MSDSEEEVEVFLTLEAVFDHPPRQIFVSRPKSSQIDAGDVESNLFKSYEAGDSYFSFEVHLANADEANEVQ